MIETKNLHSVILRLEKKNANFSGKLNEARCYHLRCTIFMLIYFLLFFVVFRKKLMNRIFLFISGKLLLLSQFDRISEYDLLLLAYILFQRSACSRPHDHYVRYLV